MAAPKGRVADIALGDDLVAHLIVAALEALGLVRGEHRNVVTERDVEQPVDQDTQVPLQPGQLREVSEPRKHPRRGPGDDPSADATQGPPAHVVGLQQPPSQSMV